MKNTKKVKMLLITLLMTSCVAAFCLGTLAYTMATGELPYDIRIPEQFKSDIPKVEPKHKAAPLPIEERTPDELTLRALDDELQEKLQSLEERETQLQEAQETLNQLITNADAIRNKTVMTLEQIKKERADKVAEIERSTNELIATQKKLEESQKTLDANIVRKIAGTLSQMRPTTSMILLADLDIKESARLLNEMPQPVRSNILAAMIEAGKPAFRAKANQLVIELRQLTENPGEKKP